MGRPQISTDGFAGYIAAVDEAFGSDVDFAQTIKAEVAEDDVLSMVNLKKTFHGSPELERISTSHMERHNLTLRMSVKRYTRRTNAFSKKLENHQHMLALYFCYYNFIRSHQTLGTTPAMAAGLARGPWSFNGLLEQLDAERPPQKRGPYKSRYSN